MKSNNRIKLDWKQLVGFNQTQQGKDSVKKAKAVLAAKIGGKPVEAKD